METVLTTVRYSTWLLRKLSFSVNY